MHPRYQQKFTAERNPELLFSSRWKRGKEDGHWGFFQIGFWKDRRIISVSACSNRVAICPIYKSGTHRRRADNMTRLSALWLYLRGYMFTAEKPLAPSKIVFIFRVGIDIQAGKNPVLMRVYREQEQTGLYNISGKWQTCVLSFLAT